MADEATASGPLGSASDVLGVVNAYGTSLLNLRDRYRGERPTNTGEVAVGVPPGKPANTVAAVRDEHAGGLSSMTKWLLGASLGLIVLGVVFKLARS